MRRRDFMVLAIGGAAMWPRSIHAQQLQKIENANSGLVSSPAAPPGISRLRR
jgi:hypothetical protein